MKTSPQIGNTNMEQMGLILEFIQNFDVDNLLYAINGKRLDEEQINSLTIDIREYNVKLEKQKEYLFRFGKDFNKKFTTEDNKCFDHSIKFTRRMRSGIAGAKKVFMRFCKPSRKKLPDGSANPQAHERSMISTPNYVADLFGLSSFPPCVVELFQVMLMFYSNLDDCIEESIRRLKEEKDIRKDTRKLIELLKNACEESRHQQAHIIEAAYNDPRLKQALMDNESLGLGINNPVLKDYKRKSKEEFAQNYFHNCKPQDIGKISLNEAISETEDPNMMMAVTVFGNDIDKIHKINYAIERFDVLLPAKCKRDQIPALYLFFFMEWCQVKTGIESFLTYFNRYYKEHGGKWNIIQKTAITGARTKHNQDKAKNSKEIKKEMLTKLKNMINEAFPQEQTA